MDCRSKTSFQQCVNGGGGVLGVRDRANDTVGRVRNEVAFGAAGVHEFHFISAVFDAIKSKRARARESCAAVLALDSRITALVKRRVSEPRSRLQPLPRNFTRAP
jgi:hypothetical protein